MKKNVFFICWVASLILVYQSLQAQVTIGSTSPPQGFSTLEISSEPLGGLRLPRMTTNDRDTKLMALPDFIAQKGVDGLAGGLTIYNIDTHCIEYWNATKWISLCLGTANITLSSSCGQPITADSPAAMVPADGTSPSCLYMPTDNPPCVVTSGQAYQIYLTAGASYASLSVDELTSAFSIQFEPNNTSNARSAIVRVANSCSGEFQDFLFQQAGSQCPAASDPTLNSTSASLCSSGKVFVHVTNPIAGVKYIWTYGSTIVQTGTYLEADREGIYRVYAGLLGCGTPATLTVSSLAGGNAQPSPVIAATNSGILCGTGTVVLTASNNNGNPVQWYHNGIPYGSANTNPITVSGESMSGEWFASVVTGGCYSASSNKITLTSSPTGTSLKLPTASVNGQNISDANLVICQGGSLSLAVTNTADYSPGTTFEWFVNGVSIGKSANPTSIYTIPSNVQNLTISVQVSYSDGSCPSSAISKSTNVTLKAPTNTSINNGASNAFICGTNPALLIAAYSNGAAYEWYLNGELAATTFGGINSHSTTTKGIYTVRYKDASGCWSKLSGGITVGSSNVIDAEWGIMPKDQEIAGSTRNYSVITVPGADQYVWSAPGAISVTPFDNANSAAIKFPDTPTNINVSVQATNGCGTVTLSKPVQVVTGCSPVVAVSILPNGATLETGQSLTFTATSANAQAYQWQLNGTNVGTGSTYTYTATNATSKPDQITVTASRTTDCISNVSSKVDVTVNPKLKDIVADNSGIYSFSGQTCFDVNMTSSGACGATTSRKNSFNSTLTFDYIFSSTISTPAVTFYTSDPDLLLESAVKVGSSVWRITFRPDIRQFISANGTREVVLTAVFNNISSQQRKMELTLNIKDCACCGAYIAPGVWKDFMCHNLGANENLDPFTPVTGVLGNLYQWGTKTEAATEATPKNAPSWNKTNPPTDSWSDITKTANDPCPEGYRVPTKAQFDGLYANNKRTNIGTWDNSLTNYNSAGIKLGELLMLPMGGYRDTAGGWVGRSWFGNYWSSTANGAQLGWRLGVTNNAIDTNTYNRIVGMSIRCIAE